MKKKLNLPILFLLFLTLSSNTYASEIENITVPISHQSKDGSQYGRKQIERQVVERVSLDMISEILGSEALSKSLSRIKTKILTQSDRYILSVAVDQKNSQANIKVSRDNLKSLLLTEGLLFHLTGSPVVLPLIVFENTLSGQYYAWWTETGGISSDRLYLLQAAKAMTEGLKKEFREKGFYVVPVDGYQSYRRVKPNNRNLSLSQSSLEQMGKAWGANVALKGTINLEKDKGQFGGVRLKANLQAIQLNNQRVIAEVVRIYKGKEGSEKSLMLSYLNSNNQNLSSDLANQVVDSWKKGIFGTSLVTVTLKGSFGYSEIQSFKTVSREKIKGIKTIREKLFDPNKIEFEVNTNLSTDQLAQQFKAIQWSSKSIHVDNIEEQKLDLSFKTL